MSRNRKNVLLMVANGLAISVLTGVALETFELFMSNDWPISVEATGSVFAALLWFGSILGSFWWWAERFRY